MKQIILAFILLYGQPALAQDCPTQAANKPATHERTPDVTHNLVDGSKPGYIKKDATPYLVTAESWIKGLLKNFTGAKLSYSNSYHFDHTSAAGKELFTNTGIKGYYYGQMRFYTYYCQQDKMRTEGESGSSVMIYFNNFFHGYGIHSLAESGDIYTVIGRPAFKVYEKAYSRGRVDFYERMWQANVNDTMNGTKDDYIIIRNSDLPLFIPLTRKEYMQQMLKDIDVNAATRIESAKMLYNPKNEAANKAKFDEELGRIDNSKMYTKEQMAPYRKRLIETWETEQQKLDKALKQIELDTKGAKDAIAEYMKKPAEWLGRTVKGFWGGYTYSSVGVKSYLDKLDNHYPAKEETGTILMYANPAYFSKTINAGTPQFIMVHIAKKGYVHMSKVAELVRQPGALDPLIAILNKGTKITTAPFVETPGPTYQLNFIPKLNSLSPLVVPADIKFSMVIPVPANKPTVAGKTPEIPVLSGKLAQLPKQVLTEDGYRQYVQDLFQKISDAIPVAEKNTLDEYVKNKKISAGVDLHRAAFAAWLQKNPHASLYLFSKVASSTTTDALAANNFSAFLIMSGFPEKAIPILQYWNKKRPGSVPILANLGNAYYRLGDKTAAMTWLIKTVQKDSLNPIANKLLCILYYKNGDIKKAEDHGIKSITKCHDEQVIALLGQLNNKIKPGEVMSCYPPMSEKQFPLLERIKMPLMPSRLYDMDEFEIELNKIKQSVSRTISDIEKRSPGELQLSSVTTNLGQGISSMRIKAQYIIMDGMQIYQTESVRESDVFKHLLKKMNVIYNNTLKGIQTKYNNQLKGLEGGEAGDEDVIAAIELAKCKAINGEKEIYLAGLSKLVNQYVARQEFISRKFYRDYANWAPYWVPEGKTFFPSIQRSYLKDVFNLLGEYQVIKKNNCEVFEPLPVKEGALQPWEDEYCANFKGKIGAGPAKIVWNCRSWSIEAGEGIVGGIGMDYAEDGSFEDFYCELGLGVSWEMGQEHVATVDAGASVKEFVKIGMNEKSGDWEVKDAGVKGEIAIEGAIGNTGAEMKVLEVTAGYRTGITKEGVAASLLNLK